ncbi:MAG TPA: ABC transporter ATP-binding protein [Pseudonocardia sp.]|jgi:ATP-binding cassette subfamily C protein
MSLPLADRRQVRRWLRATARHNRAGFTAMMLLFGLATAANLAGPRLLGQLVESARPGGGQLPVDLIALLLLAVLLGETLLRRFARFLASVFGERLLAAARENLVREAVRLPLGTVEVAGTGDLLGRATADVDKLDEGLRQAAPEILIALLMALLTAVAMLITSPLLAAGALIAVPVLVLATRWYRPRAVSNYEWMLARWADVHANTHETVTGGRTVEALGLAGRRIASQHAALGRAMAGERRAVSLWARYLGYLDLSAVIPVAAILAMGGWAYSRGLVGIGEVTATVLYARALSEPLNNALSWTDELQVGLAALRRVLGVGLAVPKSAPTTPNPEVGGGGRGLRLREVWFGYRAGQPVLRGIDLDIAPGERIAVVGPSGAGKSTLGRLLAGIENPDRGAVTLGGVPVGTLPEERRRTEVVLVTQEQHVFAGTLRENLTLPREAGDAELWAALHAVGAADWAGALPNGLDTEVGTGGAPVPMSVAQQLALARLVIADPHTLILDEATSLLDPSSARELDRSLAAVLHGRTVVTITHRLASARTADRIVVLDGGVISEQGTHSELIAAGGSYQQLVSG